MHVAVYGKSHARACFSIRRGYRCSLSRLCIEQILLWKFLISLTGAKCNS